MTICALPYSEVRTLSSHESVISLAVDMSEPGEDR